MSIVAHGPLVKCHVAHPWVRRIKDCPNDHVLSAKMGTMPVCGKTLKIFRTIADLPNLFK